MTEPPRVTILTDFGTVDGYAAAMAGVIAAVAPPAHIEHAAHDIPPGDVFTAALTLSRYAFLYPEGTVHLVVVDPGVGTERRALAAAIDGRFFVAPDNGVLTRVLDGRQDAILVAIGEPDGIDVSATFHGRDLFAPTAARLVRGEPLSDLGPGVTDPVLLPLPSPERTADGVRGEMIQVDRFGNLVTNVPAAWLRPEPGPDGPELGAQEPGAGPAAGRARRVERGGARPVVRVEDRVVGPVRRTYGDVVSGAVLALVGSLGLLEVSVRDGSAAARLDAGRGTRVTVTL
ncbi:MAG: S-adenosyl-l-methionine hydroxide adenosyltransferase family protein [Gemmatimonadota bacterium]